MPTVKRHFIKSSSGAVTYSDWPINENGVESSTFDVEESDLENVKIGTHDFDIVDGVLTLITSTRKADADAAELARLELSAEKATLKTSIESNQTIDPDIKAALTKLL